MNNRDVVVVGGGITKFASERVDASVRDLVTEAAMMAVEDAGVDLQAVEHGLTSYESDHFNRQMTLGAILHDHIGMTPKPNLRVEGGGATGALALRTAFAYVKSGLCDSIIVYGGETNRVPGGHFCEPRAACPFIETNRVPGGHPFWVVKAPITWPSIAISAA